MSMVLKNGFVFTMVEGQEPKVQDVLVEDGLIKAVGEKLNGDETIDCTGKLVFPGFIDSHCHIGVFGTAMGERGVDGNEDTSPVTPQLRAIDGINPYDVEYRHSYEHGVTTVSTGPGSANPICGQFVTMKTYGKTFRDMIIKEPGAMKMAFGENPKTCHPNGGPVTRMATAAIIRENLFKAKRYAEDKEKAGKEGKPLPPFDFKLEALVPVVKGELKVKAHAHRADDILTALRIAEEFNLKMSIEHCSEGHLIPDELGFAQGVIIGPIIDFPHKLEVMNRGPEAGRVFYEHGVKFAIMSDLPATHTSDILMEAGMCVKEGLPSYEALKAVTINAAEILEVEDRVGSLFPGKDADIVVFDENPVESLKAHCLMTIVGGKVVHKAI